MEEIYSNRDVPLYVQLKNILKNQILSGAFKPGDRLPSENELGQVYRVSRITVRQAINALVQEGLVCRRQGRGTFVASPKLRRRLPKLYSFSEDMLELGLKPSSRVITQRVIEAEADVAELLHLSGENKKVNEIVRVRLANEDPILVEHTYIPYFLCPELIQEDLSKGSLYAILRDKYGLVLVHAFETYEVGKVGKEEASFLGCRRGLPAFLIERVAFLRSDVPAELTRSVARGDRLRFTVHLVADQAQIRRRVDFEEDRK